MPCFAVQKPKVEFLAKSTDTNLPADARRGLGFSVK
jgi:hypothetical protein